MNPIPVILDTDIGSDIDDTWALAMLLKSPELDVRLITTATEDTLCRARIVARMLACAGRTDIPIGVGCGSRRFRHGAPRQAEWVRDYPFEQYPGTVQDDGVAALVETIMKSPVPLTLLVIGPMTNIAEALVREPCIAGRVNLIGMQGSFAKHHVTNRTNAGFQDGAIAEWNVVCDVPAAQAVFRAPWRNVTLTPLDTCGCVMLDGARYARLKALDDPVMRAVLENYRIWSTPGETSDPERHSSVLFDTVAIYLAFSTRHLEMQTMNVIVDDQGFTREDPSGRPMQVAMAWRDLEAYYDFLTRRLGGPLTRRRRE
jgi:inosine-uridine nucleoside N-ribohydrolase